MKNTLRQYIALALLLSVSLYAVGSTHAAWSDPSSVPSGGNVDLPVTSLLDAQVKNAGLSVGVFDAAGFTQFDQQTFFKDVIKGIKYMTVPRAGGGVLQYWTDAPLRIGGTDASNTIFDVEVTATGTIKTLQTFGAGELISQKGEKRALCADEQGHVVFCPIPAPLPPSFELVGKADTQGSSNANAKVNIYAYIVGPNMIPGTKYNLNIYNHQITVTSVTGDTAKTIVDKLVAAVNNTTATEWRSGVPNSAPVNGTAGFPPRAEIWSYEAAVFDVILDYPNTIWHTIN